jgi:hypothetical protein
MAKIPERGSIYPPAQGRANSQKRVGNANALASAGEASGERAADWKEIWQDARN